MSTHWLDIQSFQQSQELLSAINTLSIHRKLTDKGYLDIRKKESAEQAIETLVAFFKNWIRSFKILKMGIESLSWV